MNYIDRLIKNCELAKTSSPTREFELSDPSELDGIKTAVYVIEQTSGDIEKSFVDFSTFKDKKERKCAKLNSPSHTMYVGSSSTNIKKRIAEHEGDGHKETYALHLRHWFKGQYKIIVKEYNVAKEVLQIIEDDLSEQLKPAFGKQGGNNK